MESREVQDIVHKEEVPWDQRKILKIQMDLKIKRNGIFRAKLVVCAYSQVPCVDFNESYAPVIYDVSFDVC